MDIKTTLLVALSLCSFLFASIVNAETVPIVIAIHKAVYNDSGEINVKQLEEDVTKMGLFPFNIPKVLAVPCLNVNKLITITFDGADLLSEARRLFKQKDITVDDLTKIQKIVGRKLDPNSTKLTLTSLKTFSLNMWSVYSEDPTILNVLKSLSLRKAGILRGGSSLSNAMLAILPIVYIVLPTHSLFEFKTITKKLKTGNPKLSKRITLGRFYGGLGEPGSKYNFIALAYSSLVKQPNRSFSPLGEVMFHETGHYLGLWHNFTYDYDLDFEKQNTPVHKSAEQIFTEPKCAKSEQYKGGKIMDVDYYRSHDKVWDTKPIWFDDVNISKICMDEYKDLPAKIYPDPRSNLMNWLGSFEYALKSNNPSLTESQMQVVIDELKSHNNLKRPQNICAP